MRDRESFLQSVENRVHGSHQTRVMALLYGYSYRDWTRWEIAKALGLSINLVTKPVYNLRNDGYIDQSALSRRCTVTGKQAHPVKYSTHPLAVARAAELFGKVAA